MRTDCGFQQSLLKLSTYFPSLISYIPVSISPLPIGPLPLCLVIYLLIHPNFPLDPTYLSFSGFSLWSKLFLKYQPHVSFLRIWKLFLQVVCPEQAFPNLQVGPHHFSTRVQIIFGHRPLNSNKITSMTSILKKS